MDPDTPDPEPTARWSLRDAITSRDGYLLLLVLALAQLALWLLAEQGEAIVHVVAYWLLLLTIIVAMHRAHVHATAFRAIALGLLVVGAAWSTVVLITGKLSGGGLSTPIGISSLMYAALLALAFPLIVRRAFAHRIVSIDTMCAALTAYIFIGLFFAAIIRSVGALGGSFFVQDVPTTTENAVYFAFESLTTLGMGDLTPVSGFPRMLTIFCALAGQLYLVTAVARIVSLFGQERQGKLVD